MPPLFFSMRGRIFFNIEAILNLERCDVIYNSILQLKFLSTQNRILHENVIYKLTDKF